MPIDNERLINSKCGSVSNIKIYYCNVQSLRNKLSELHDILYTSDYNIVALTETWLIPQLTDGLLDPLGRFCIYRRDRSNRAGGGVCLIISNILVSSNIAIDYTVFQHVELIGSIAKIGNLHLSIFCYYSAPNTTAVNFKHSLDCLDSILTSCAIKTVLLLGDFNVPAVSWEDPVISSHTEGSKVFELIAFSRRFDLDQLNYFPTRGESVLDLVFTNDKLILSDLIVGPPFGSSDHDSLFLTLLCNNDSVKSTTVDNNNNYGPSVAKLNWKLID